MVISNGLPAEAVNIELFTEPEGNGISGYVAATGRSYICPDVERDPRYIFGLDQARSSLTVPLTLHDRVIGVFNIESRQRAAFNEDDRQFAEIFGRYVALALNILDLMIVERVSTSHKVADDVCSEVAGPLNDIASDATALLDEYIGHDDLRQKLQQILDNVGSIRHALRQVAEGPNKSVLGAADVKGEDDPVLGAARILVADDEPNIRTTISDVLRKYHAQVTVATSGTEAISLIEQQAFDLVLSDIKMPDKTGYDVFAAARRASQTVPVILMTGFGYDPNHSIVRASQEGLHAVLFKPFKVDQLLTEVRKALQAQSSVR
jgi:CheY-like chemotaxis protein